MGADVPPVFTDAAWTWMLGKLTTETVPALGDDVISSIQGKVDKSQGSTNAKKFLRVNTSGNVSLASTDKTLSVADQIADAKETGDQIRALDAEIDGVVTTLGGSISTLNGITTDLQSSKLNKNQGTSNAGKTMVVDSSGNIVPGDVPITIDDTLSIADAAADAKATGDAIALKANASTIAPEFNDQSSYAAGSYVLKNGVLHRFTQSHSGAWTGTDVETVTVGGEVTDLKADLVDVKDAVLDDNSTILHEASADYIYSNALNNAYVWMLKTPFPQYSKPKMTIYGKSAAGVGSGTIYFLKKNTDESYSVVDSITITTVIGTNAVNIPQGLTDNGDIYVAFYSTNHFITYNSSSSSPRRKEYTRFSYSDPLPEQISVSGSYMMDFNVTIEYELIDNYIADLQARVDAIESTKFVIVDASGTGDYTSLLTAMQTEQENTVIFVRPGVYNQDMTSCLKKRVIVIGADRNQCIIRDTDGRYGHHPLYISCGYFENLTIEAPYISGESQEIGVSDLGAYAVHIDTDDDYAIGKQCEFHHCNISSDFFPAVGLGMRKDATYIFDDCTLTNGQILNRGDYSDVGTLGALYFHDSNGTQGNQYIIIKDCVLKSKLAYAMCVYQVNREPQNNRVYCDFINNVLYSDVGKYADTVWFRGNPFDATTGIFSIGIGYGNSIDSLNNN